MKSLIECGDQTAEYWGGYLAADGSIRACKNKHAPTRYILSLSSKDYEIVNKFATFVDENKQNITGRLQKPARNPDPTSNVELKERVIFSCWFNCTEQFEMMRKLYGLTPNKSKTYAPGECQSRDFWRGYVDGDGWLSKSKGGLWYRPGICGTENTCRAFITHIQTHMPECSLGLREKRPGFFIVETRNKMSSLLIANYLYKDAPPNARLERKYTRALVNMAMLKIE